MHVERRNRNAETSPHPVVVDAPRHDIDEDLVLADRPGRQDLEPHRCLRRTVPFLADCPGVHLSRHVAERGNFAGGVEILARGRLRLADGTDRHGYLRVFMPWRSGVILCCTAISSKAWLT